MQSSVGESFQLIQARHAGPQGAGAGVWVLLRKVPLLQLRYKEQRPHPVRQRLWSCDLIHPLCGRAPCLSLSPHTPPCDHTPHTSLRSHPHRSHLPVILHAHLPNYPQLPCPAGGIPVQLHNPKHSLSPLYCPLTLTLPPSPASSRLAGEVSEWPGINAVNAAHDGAGGGGAGGCPRFVVLIASTSVLRT